MLLENGLCFLSQTAQVVVGLDLEFLEGSFGSGQALSQPLVDRLRRFR